MSGLYPEYNKKSLPLHLVWNSQWLKAENKETKKIDMAVELKDLTKSDENYSQWYNDLVMKAGLAENSAVRGCMVTSSRIE